MIQEQTNESKIENSASLDASAGQVADNSASAHIDLFLKTATAEDMDAIRESLSNFHEVSKNFSNIPSANKKDDDDTEEDFEEEIPEDQDEDNSSSEEHKFEVIPKKKPAG